jgi:katanin p60 ATPase-containing subunit A1
VKFEDIVGLDQPKTLIKEALLLPMIYPQFFTGILEPWKGILLFGPPGTGKTLLAKAVATEMRCTFFNISAATIVSKWRGDSEKIIKVLFDLARYYQPSTIFLDEIDSIMNKRGGSSDEHEGSRRMKTELLIQLDGLSKKENERVFLLAASNLPWDLDSALLRRLEKRIIIDLPDKDARMIMLKKIITKSKDLNWENLAESTQGYSGSDIKLVCKEALMKGVRRAISFLEKSKQTEIPSSIEIDKTTQEDFHEALASTRPASVYKSEKYIKWMESFGSF